MKKEYDIKILRLLYKEIFGIFPPSKYDEHYYAFEIFVNDIENNIKNWRNMKWETLKYAIKYY